MKDNKKRLIFILGMFSLVFILVIVYLVYFQLFMADDLAQHPNNRRNSVDEANIVRGNIYDRNDVILARDQKDDNGIKYRELIYPYSYSHLIGYRSEIYGNSGIERYFNNYILDIQGKDPINELRRTVITQGVGNDVKLTIDNDLQLKANELMDGHKGAAIIMKPSTGEVLAMLSSPNFDANRVDSLWEGLINNESSPLFDRALHGQYIPGSIAKIVSSLAIMESGIDENYYDSGKAVIDGYTFENYGSIAYGDIDLEDAIDDSVNTYFADKALEVGRSKFREVYDRFLFNKEFDFDLPASGSKAPFRSDMGDTELAASSFGQGTLIVSPLHMAMMISSISNDGIMMQPYIVSNIYDKNGKTLYEAEEKVLSKVGDIHDIEKLQSYLRNNLTGENIDIYGYEIAGKTGTAENETDNWHGWFVGYEKEEDVAVAVVVEEAGEVGALSAQPIAEQLFRLYFELN